MTSTPIGGHLRQNVISADSPQGRLFRHPEPPRERTRVWPVYLSFHGCPGRCVFCAQPVQAGAPPVPLAQTLAAMERELDRAARDGRGPYDLAFYGGVFTALPEPWPRRFLEAGLRFRRAGLIRRMRCSTRPDARPPKLLAELAGLGLDQIGRAHG